MEKLIREINQKIYTFNILNSNRIEPIDGHKIYLYGIINILAHLESNYVLTRQECISFCSEYLYLYPYTITAPRNYGEQYAQNRLKEFIPELQCPTKVLDPNYSGQYDFWFDGIRIEVKSSRAVSRNVKGPLITRALQNNANLAFDMNFQQIKPNCCDVFVFIAEFMNETKFFVLSSDEVAHNKYYSIGQHRGNVGEGQLWLKESNIAEFECYEVSVREILDRIRQKGRK